MGEDDLPYLEVFNRLSSCFPARHMTLPYVKDMESSLATVPRGTTEGDDAVNNQTAIENVDEEKPPEVPKDDSVDKSSNVSGCPSTDGNSEELGDHSENELESESSGEESGSTEDSSSDEETAESDESAARSTKCSEKSSTDATSSSDDTSSEDETYLEAKHRYQMDRVNYREDENITHILRYMEHGEGYKKTISKSVDLWKVIVDRFVFSGFRLFLLQEQDQYVWLEHLETVPVNSCVAFTGWKYETENRWKMFGKRFWQMAHRFSMLDFEYMLIPPYWITDHFDGTDPLSPVIYLHANMIVRFEVCLKIIDTWHAGGQQIIFMSLPLVSIPERVTEEIVERYKASTIAHTEKFVVVNDRKKSCVLDIRMDRKRLQLKQIPNTECEV